jgi:peptidoglycan/xylan/chitin deacetylase (PgdA/CDA1 family)
LNRPELYLAHMPGSRILSLLSHLIRSKGPFDLFRRGYAIFERVGLTAGALNRALGDFAALAARYDARVTFPVTALTLARHPTLLRALLGDGATVELAIHGYRHIDHSLLPPSTLADEIAHAVALFRAQRIPFTGFRAPYLRWSDDLLAALASADLAYDSSQPILWPVIDTAALSSEQHQAMDTLLAFDRPAPAETTPALPFWVGDLLELPVSFPDDEMLVERLRLREAGAIAQHWIAAFDRCHARGEMFVLQLPPERFHLCAAALERLLDHVARLGPAVWRASLGDVAAWWSQQHPAANSAPTEAAAKAGEEPSASGDGAAPGRWPGAALSAFVLSGDIDAITVWDYAARVVGR